MGYAVVFMGYTRARSLHLACSSFCVNPSGCVSCQVTSRDHTGFHCPGLVAVVCGFISASKGADIAIANIQFLPLVERAMAWHQVLQMLAWKIWLWVMQMCRTFSQRV